MSNNTMGLVLERIWPWIGCAFVGAAYAWIGAPFPKGADGLLGAAATVSSVFASFLGVSQALIISINQSETYTRLESMGYVDLLFSYLRTAIFSAVAFAAVSIFGFFIENGFEHYKIFTITWATVGAFALFSYSRVSTIFFKLMRRV